MKHIYDIQKLKHSDAVEWNKFYSQIKGMIRSKEFLKSNAFDEDVFADSIIAFVKKLETIDEKSNIINLMFAIYRNTKSNALKLNQKFNKKEYVQTEEGFSEKTPDYIASDEIQQEQFEDDNQFEFEFNEIKEKLKEFQEKEPLNSTAKKIDLLNFYLEFLDGKETVSFLIKKYELKSQQNLMYLNKKIKKYFGGTPILKKGRKPTDEVSKAMKSKRKNESNKR